MLGDFDILARKHRFTRREHFYVLADPLGRIVGENAVLGKNALEFKTARAAFFAQIQSLVPVDNYFGHKYAVFIVIKEVNFDALSPPNSEEIRLSAGETPD